MNLILPVINNWLKGMLLVSLMSSLSFNSFCQIVGGDGKDIEDDKINRDSLTGTTYYLTGMFNYGHRKFQDNSVYGSYSDWNSQKADYSGGGTIGLLMPLGYGFSLDLGITYFGHKEKFNFSDTDSDSTFYFSNTYVQIGIPVRLRYTYGERFQFFGFAGVTPVNVLNVRYLDSYTRKNGIMIENEVQIVKDKLSIFNVMATAGIGLTYNFDWVGLTLYPEFRHYLGNTYLPQKPISHKMYGLGIHAGMTLRF